MLALAFGKSSRYLTPLESVVQQTETEISSKRARCWGCFENIWMPRMLTRTRCPFGQTAALFVPQSPALQSYQEKYFNMIVLLL